MKMGLDHKFEFRQELPRSLKLVHELEDTDDEKLIKEKLGEMLDSISDDLGIRFQSNVGELYKKMNDDGCLVRVEKLSRVLETVELENDLRISDENESHYANAVIPTLEGIKIALSEGQAPGPIRAVVGFGKTIIGFKSDSLKVEEVDFSENDIRDAQERKFLCRHVVGKLGKDEIRYLVMRIPFALVKKDHLSSEEIEKAPAFIFRGAPLH